MILQCRLALIDCRDWQDAQSYTYAGLDELADACGRGRSRRRRFKANWQTRLLGAVWRLDDVGDIIGVETVNVPKGRLNGPNQVGCRTLLSNAERKSCAEQDPGEYSKNDH
jgi:hypothetical protein